MSVDWSRPIEAVHDDGRVVPVQRFLGLNATNVMPTLEGGWFSFCEDGRHSFLECPWRIRNVTQPAPTPDELAKRMEELVRHAAKNASGYTQEEARAIIALLPAPVDPDLVEARNLATDHSCMDIDYLGSGGDQTPLVQIALAAIKRGRALERREP